MNIKIQYKRATKDGRPHRINIIFPHDFLSVWGLAGNTLTYNLGKGERPTNKMVCQAVASIMKTLK